MLAFAPLELLPRTTWSSLLRSLVLFLFGTWIGLHANMGRAVHLPTLARYRVSYFKGSFTSSSFTSLDGLGAVS